MTDADRKRRRAAIARRRREDAIALFAVPGLPLDGDPPQLRGPAAMPPDLAFSLAERELAAALNAGNPFLDTLRESWTRLFPGVPLRPDRIDGTKIFLCAATAVQLYSARRHLPEIRRRLKELPGAPRKFTLHLELRPKRA